MSTSQPVAGSKGGQRPLRGVGQDKGASDAAPKSSLQPAPVTNVVRFSLQESSAGHEKNLHAAKERKVRGSIWMQPKVKLAMLHIAKLNGDSFSEACDTALEVYARQKIHDQQEALFEPRFRKIAREENRSLGNRLVFFEMRNAIAAEQTRILTTDLYKRQLQKEGVQLKEINQKLDDAYTMARDNILRKARTPQLKNLLAAWWRSTEEQADGSHQENTDTGAAVLGKREA